MSRPKLSGTTVSTVSTSSCAMRDPSAAKLSRPDMARMVAHRVDFAKPTAGRLCDERAGAGASEGPVPSCAP
jgi:hypothetical protein